MDTDGAINWQLKVLKMTYNDFKSVSDTYD
jgi:hypothetical protein